jgi:hypothetical protein
MPLPHHHTPQVQLNAQLWSAERRCHARDQQIFSTNHHNEQLADDIEECGYQIAALQDIVQEANGHCNDAQRQLQQLEV